MSAKTKRKPLALNGQAPTVTIVPPAPLLKLDFGAGPHPREGFDGVDQYSFDGKVKHVMQIVEPIWGLKVVHIAERPPHPDFVVHSKRPPHIVEMPEIIGYKPWPWPDCSVEEAHSSHFVEHLTSVERVHFVNELYRVMVPGGKATIIVPHWASCRAYGDPTHAWAPVSEFWPYYLSQTWRMANAPHTDASNWPLGFKANLEAVWGYGGHVYWSTRNSEAQQFAFQWYKEAIQDMHITITKPMT